MCVCVCVCMIRVYGVNVAGQSGWFPRSIWDECFVSIEIVDGSNWDSNTDKCVSVSVHRSLWGTCSCALNECFWCVCVRVCV